MAPMEIVSDVRLSDKNIMDKKDSYKFCMLVIEGMLGIRSQLTVD